MKKLLLFLFVSLIVASCSAIKTVKLLNRGSVVQQTFKTEIPFMQTSTGHIIVKVVIKGQEHKFIFDTGAPNVISTELAEKLHAKPLVEAKASDSQKKKQNLNLVQLDSVFLNEVCFVNTSALIVDIQKSNEVRCLGAEGIIGNNLMKNAVWTIDFERKIITLSSEADKSYLQSATVIPFYTQLSSPKIDLEINNIKDKDVTIDFGSNGYYHTQASLFKKIKHQGVITKYAYAYGSVASGMFGAVTDTTFIAVIPQWKMGVLTFTNNEISFSEKTAKTVGCSFFQNFITTLDFKNKTMYMQKVKEPQEKKPTSFGFLPAMADKKIMAAKIVNTSTVAHSGIKEGTQILSVNGVSYENASQDMYCDFITQMRNNETVKIVFLTNNEKRELILNKEETFK